MKKMTRMTAFLLLVVLALTTLGGCFGDPAGPTGSSSASTTGNNKPSTPAGKQTYSVEIVSIGGMPIAGAGVYVYTDSTLDDLEDYKAADENGRVSFSLERSNTWHVVIRGVPDGYELAASYPLQAGTTRITLTSRVIADEDIADVVYSEGDIMHDFTVTTIEGERFKLSEVLKEKRAVLINFWYSACDPCRAEFPYMQQAYEEYKDEIAIIGLNHYGKDTEEIIRAFAGSLGLTFEFAKDYTDLPYAFNVDAYPTSIIVDRYGMICVIEEGGITSVKPFRALFEHFTADDYKQQIITDIGALIPVEKPDVEMPSSDEMKEAFGAADMNATFTPETDPSDAEMSWPFLIGEGEIGGEDGKYIYPANSERDSSFATLYVNVELKAGEVLAFDYFASTEQYMDVLFVLIDRKDIYQISGDSEELGWKTCYPFVALEDGSYELAFCYYKDEGDNYGDDTVYLRNLRVETEDEIDVATYIPRFAATKPKANGFGYENYVDIVLGADGYYHVGSATGPILLVDMMGATRFSNDSLFLLAYNGQIDPDRDFYAELLPYFTLSSNSALNGLCSVNEELAELLKDVAEAIGLELDNPDQWLQMCCYYNAYGTDGVEMEDPVKGLAPSCAYDAQLGSENTVTYNRVIMPRGLLYKFVPEQSGVYRITSDSKYEVDGWIFLEDRTEYLVYEGTERAWIDPVNCSMVAYLEAGTAYYIDIAFYDVYQTGTFTFDISYIGESYDLFRAAAPGYFTYEESEDFAQSGNLDDLNSIIALGIDIELGEDGYYHEKLANGELGSIVYADLTRATSIFSKPLSAMINLRAFDFRLSELDHEILVYLEKYGDDYETELRKLWGEDYDELYELYQVDDVLDGIYHGAPGAKDYTAEMRAYLELVEGDEHPEREGCVAVDEELAAILQTLMDKFTFEGVENSWLKLCYYYDHLAAEASTEGV